MIVYYRSQGPAVSTLGEVTSLGGQLSTFLGDAQIRLQGQAGIGSPLSYLISDRYLGAWKISTAVPL